MTTWPIFKKFVGGCPRQIDLESPYYKTLRKAKIKKCALDELKKLIKECWELEMVADLQIEDVCRDAPKRARPLYKALMDVVKALEVARGNDYLLQKLACKLCDNMEFYTLMRHGALVLKGVNNEVGLEILAEAAGQVTEEMESSVKQKPRGKGRPVMIYSQDKVIDLVYKWVTKWKEKGGLNCGPENPEQGPPTKKPSFPIKPTFDKVAQAALRLIGCKVSLKTIQSRKSAPRER